MAILLYFRKDREDETRVEYRYGPPEEMDRLLVIDKASQEGTPAAGTPDKAFAAVMSKILRQRRETQTWPDRGTYAA